MNEQVAFLNQLLENFFTLGGEDFDKMQASRNLSALSQTQDFLDISMTLLSAYQLSENKMLLLSCMIKDKFRYDFELIDSQKLKSYYQLLCEFASKFGTKCKPFFNNISQSLALIYLNQIACNDLPLTEFLAIFQTEDQNQFALFNYYFKILEQCAEHVNNSRVVLDEEYRKIAKEKIKNQQLQVIQILNEAVKTVWYNPLVSKMVSKIRIINCFTSWIDLNYDPQIFNNLHDTSLLNEIVICLRTEPNQAESAVECLKALIQRIQSPQKNSQLFQYLGSACYELVPYIDARIAQGQLEKVEELMSLVIFFSQKFSVFLVQTYSEHTRNFLMSLIRYMNTNLPKTVDLLIQFWQDLVQLFVSAKHEKTLSMELKMDLPIALLHVLIEKCTYPPAILRQLETVFQHKIGRYFDLGEQIFNNRFSAESCFDGLAQLLGVNYYIDYIRQNISELDYKQPMFFSTLEAYLYALIPALKKLQDITASVRVIIQTYEHLFKNMQPILLGVKRTFLKVFKAILGIKIKDHNLTQKIYYFTIECLSDTMLVDTAAKAFQKACQYNPHYLYNIIVQISGIVKNHVYEEQIVRGYITLASFNKKNASFVISDCLEFLLSHARHDFLDGLRSKQCVDTLTCAIKEIKDCSFEGKKELLKDFVKQAWDFILTTLKSPLSSSQDQDLKIERIVKLIKTIMRTLKSDFIPYLSQLFTTVNEYFQKYPICSYIYLLQIAVTVFSALQNEQIQTFLKEVYQNFTQSAFAHLQNQQNIEDYSFLLDDFLGMNARLLIYNTKIIVSSSHFVNLITFITEVCLQTTTNRAVKATYSFLQTLFMIYWNNDFIQAYNKEQREEEKDNSISIQPIIEDINLYGYLNQHLKGELTVMIKRMLEHLASIPADSTKNQILDTLLSQIKAFTDVNPQIWKQILSQISPNILLQTEKEHIILLMESIRQQLQIFEKVRVWVKQLNNFLNLIYRRMVMADKRRKINIKD